MRYYELTISFVDRGVDPPQSRTMGILRWDADAPEQGADELSSIDAVMVELLRAYVDQYDRKLTATKQRISEQNDVHPV